MKQEEYLYLKSKDIPLYNGKFVFIITNSANKLTNYVSTICSDDKLYAHSFIGESYKGRQAFIVALNFNRKEKITHGVIAHEALHMVSFLGMSRKFKIDIENDEPATYLLEWFVDEMYKFIKEKNFEVV